MDPGIILQVKMGVVWLTIIPSNPLANFLLSVPMTLGSAFLEVFLVSMGTKVTVPGTFSMIKYIQVHKTSLNKF